MIVKKTTEKDLRNALKKTNRYFENNIEFAKFEYLSKNKFRIRLKVKDSKQPGARRGFTGRRLISACWHVHGIFVDCLNKDAITQSTLGQRCPGEQWRDKNIGSIMNPLAYSNACEC